MAAETSVLKENVNLYTIDFNPKILILDIVLLSEQSLDDKALPQ